jgi:hypothetical protein
MHEPFQPQCGLCARFVYCFPRESLLADWGYCQAQVGCWAPTKPVLRRLERLAAKGTYEKLYSLPLALYQVTDDGCADFVHADPPPS